MDGDVVKYHADGYTGCYLHFDGNESALPGSINPQPRLLFMPNPVTANAQLIMEGFKGNLDIGVYDIRGVRVLHFTGIKDKKIDLNIRNLQSGVYFINVFDAHHQTVVKTVNLIK